MKDIAQHEQTPLSRALHRIAKGTRLSSLDVPVLHDAATEIDSLTAFLKNMDRKWRARIYDLEAASDGQTWQEAIATLRQCVDDLKW